MGLDDPAAMTPTASARASGRAQAQAFWALALLLPAPILGPALMLFVFPGAIGTASAFACKLWMLLLPWVWLVKVDRQPIVIAKPSRLGLAAGMASGVLIGVVMTAVFAIVRGQIDLGPLRAKASETGFNRPAVLVGIFAYIILVNSLLEEYVWRWFVFSKLEAIMPGRGHGRNRGASASAAVLTGLLFTIHHVLSLAAWVDWRLNILASAGVCLGGWIWSALYLRFRSIWPGYASHVFADLAIFGMAWTLIFS